MTIKLPKRGTAEELVQALANALLKIYPAYDHTLDILDWTHDEIIKRRDS